MYSRPTRCSARDSALLIKYRVDYLLPSAYTTLLHRSDNTLVNLSVLLRKNGDKTANFVSVGFAVNGTAGFYHRQPATAYRRGNIFFFNEDHGTIRRSSRRVSSVTGEKHPIVPPANIFIKRVWAASSLWCRAQRHYSLPPAPLCEAPPTHPCAKAAGLDFYVPQNDFPSRVRLIMWGIPAPRKAM